jgi:EmrB/QacA subfamily drug resistance transporter
METSKKWVIVGVVAMGLALALMDGTIVNVILPQLQKAFQTDFATITWAITGYILALAAVTPIVGYLSDLFSSKRVFLVALAVFTVGSVLCGLAPTKEALFIFRVVQAIGGGALIPVVYTILYRIFPPNERAVAGAILSVPVLLAPALGPTIGGYLSTNFNWNSVFMINLPFGIVGLLLGFIVLPTSDSGGKSDREEVPQTKGTGKHLDIQGLLLAIVGFTTLVYGLNGAASQGWGNPTVLSYLLIGTIVLIAFVLVELQASDPVLDLRLFMNFKFTIANVLTWMAQAVFYGSLFLFPLFFENVQGDTALTAGELLLGQGLALAISITIAGVLYNRLGPRILTIVGLLFVVGGTYGLTQIDTNTTGQALQIWLILRGFGLGFIIQGVQTLAASVISNQAMAKAMSLLNAMRQLATALALAVLTTSVTQQTLTHVADITNALQVGLRTHQFSGVAATCIQASGSAEHVAAVKACVEQHGLTLGITDTFWIVLILGVISIPVALTMGRDPAIEALKQAKVRNKDSRTTDVSIETADVPVKTTSVPNVISTLSANGEQMLGPEMLLWCYPKNNVAHGSLLAVESNNFCVLKSRGVILDVYETGQHIVQTPNHPLFNSTQLAFDGELIPLEYEVFYINRAKSVGKASGVALSQEMAEVGYWVDYSIHVATHADAIRLVQNMPHRGHTLTIQEINAYVELLIEQVLNQLVQTISLKLGEARMGASPTTPNQGLQMQDFSQLVQQRIQKYLSSYGITLTVVDVLVNPLVRPFNTPSYAPVGAGASPAPTSQIFSASNKHTHDIGLNLAQ